MLSSGASAQNRRMQAPSFALGTERSPEFRGTSPQRDDFKAPGLFHALAGVGASLVPGPRLTSKQLRAISATWRARAAAGDDSANLVADTLDWVAEQRAKQEPPAIKVLARRISQWMGL